MPRFRNRNIPDRWIDYYPFKDVITDVNIVPFKVPLPLYKFQDSFMSRYKWTPSDAMENIKNLGLVIDLTFKFPCYYEPIQFLENGVDYIKIGCPGHVIPPTEIFLKFCNVVDAFQEENPDLVVGVHCTHGVNRTGYMICRYMVEKRGYTAEKALQIFAESRGYEVERVNYKQHILSLERSK